MRGSGDSEGTGVGRVRRLEGGQKQRMTLAKRSMGWVACAFVHDDGGVPVVAGVGDWATLVVSCARRKLLHCW